MGTRALHTLWPAINLMLNFERFQLKTVATIIIANHKCGQIDKALLGSLGMLNEPHPINAPTNGNNRLLAGGRRGEGYDEGWQKKTAERRCEGTTEGVTSCKMWCCSQYRQAFNRSSVSEKGPPMKTVRHWLDCLSP